MDDEDVPLVALIRDVVRDATRTMHTCMAARVDAFDPDTQTVDVVLIALDPEDGETYPKLTRVPFVFPRFNGFVITWPIRQGDVVEVRFFGRSHSEWLSGSEGASPQSERRFSLNDAVAGPGPTTWREPIAGLVRRSLFIGREDGSGSIQIDEDGTVRLGSDEAVLAPIARQGDETTISSEWRQWLQAVATGAGVLAPQPTSSLANISTGSSKVMSE